MKSKKSACHDGITSEGINLYRADEISIPISVILNRSIEEGTVEHEAMKLAEVVPVPIYTNKEKGFKN